MYLVALSLVMVVIMAFAVISITPPATSDNKDATDLDQDMGTCGDGLIWDYSWYTIYIYYTERGPGRCMITVLKIPHLGATCPF